MKLPRPYIPLAKRVLVARRQMHEGGMTVLGIMLTNYYGKTPREELRQQLFALFGNNEVHLDHDPPLATREKIRRNGKVVRYKPDANDADFLIYRNADAHRTKTNVRGDGAQYPDRVLIKKIRRIERPKPKKKYNWPKRKLRWRDDHTKRNPSSQSRAVRISRSAHRHRAPHKSGHS